MFAWESRAIPARFQHKHRFSLAHRAEMYDTDQIPGAQPPLRPGPARRPAGISCRAFFSFLLKWILLVPLPIRPFGPRTARLPRLREAGSRPGHSPPGEGSSPGRGTQEGCPPPPASEPECQRYSQGWSPFSCGALPGEGAEGARPGDQRLLGALAGSFGLNFRLRPEDRSLARVLFGDRV